MIYSEDKPSYKMDTLKEEAIKQYVAGVSVKEIESRFCQGGGLGVLYRWLKTSNTPLRGRGRGIRKKNKWHKDRKHAIKQYVAGVSMKEITSIFSISIVTLYRWLKASKVSLHESRSNRMKLKHKCAIKWYLAGRKVKDIALFFNISECALYKLFEKHQIVDCVKTDEEN